MADESTPTKIPPTTDVAASIADTLHTIFLAGVGAIATTGEKSGELFDQLVAKGKDTVAEGVKTNDELLKRAKTRVSDTAQDALRTYLKNLSPEDRAEFVASVQKVAAEAEADEVADDVVDGDVADGEATDA